MAQRFEFDPTDDGLQGGPTLDDILMLVLATGTVLGLLILISLTSVSATSRLEDVISHLAS